VFEKFRTTINSFSSTISERTLKNDEVEKILSEFEMNLIGSDVSPDIAEILKEKIKDSVIGSRINRSKDSTEYLRSRLKDAVIGIMSDVPQTNILNIIQDKRNSGEISKILFLGINGTGKTTTIAKFAKMLKDRGFSSVLACGDTHRAGAIEQLSVHAQRLSIKTIAQSYGADPAAVARDAILYARSHRLDVVLIDTAGRMQTSKNLMEEMSKIIRVVNPDFKILVVDSLAGNDAISQTKEFSDYTDFDAAILTKIDADAKGGAALSIAHVSGKPIIFLGNGQEYNDLIPFELDSFVSSIFDQS
jgi:fused signal recognition particle receptor